DCAPRPWEFALSVEMVHTCSRLVGAKKGDKYGPGSGPVAQVALVGQAGGAVAAQGQAAAEVPRLADRGHVPVVRVARPAAVLGVRPLALWRAVPAPQAAQRQPVQPAPPRRADPAEPAAGAR